MWISTDCPYDFSCLKLCFNCQNMDEKLSTIYPQFIHNKVELSTITLIKKKRNTTKLSMVVNLCNVRNTNFLEVSTIFNTTCIIPRKNKKATTLFTEWLLLPNKEKNYMKETAY